MQVEGPDCHLFVESAGLGEPITVFAHGITGSSDEVTPFASRTPGTRILFDFRGHGASGSPASDAGYDHPAMRRDLEFVADHTGATRAFGASMGGGALLNLLVDRPDRFERIVLSTPASIDGPNEGAVALFPWIADMLETSTLDEVLEQTLHPEVPSPLFEQRPYWIDLTRRRVARMNATGMPRALRAYVDGAPPVSDVEALREVVAPVLILAHAGDPIHDIAHARRLASIFPNAELRVWDEPLEMWDDVEATAALIGSFLAG